MVGVFHRVHQFIIQFIYCLLALQVADSWEALDGWLDAMRLVYTIYARGKADVLAGIITG